MVNSMKDGDLSNRRAAVIIISVVGVNLFNTFGSVVLNVALLYPGRR